MGLTVSPVVAVGTGQAHQVGGETLTGRHIRGVDDEAEGIPVGYGGIRLRDVEPACAARGDGDADVVGRFVDGGAGRVELAQKQRDLFPDDVSLDPDAAGVDRARDGRRAAGAGDPARLVVEAVRARLRRLVHRPEAETAVESGSDPGGDRRAVVATGPTRCRAFHALVGDPLHGPGGGGLACRRGRYGASREESAEMKRVSSEPTTRSTGSAERLGDLPESMRRRMRAPSVGWRLPP